MFGLLLIIACITVAAHTLHPHYRPVAGVAVALFPATQLACCYYMFALGHTMVFNSRTVIALGGEWAPTRTTIMRKGATFLLAASSLITLSLWLGRPYVGTQTNDDGSVSYLMGHPGQQWSTLPGHIVVIICCWAALALASAFLMGAAQQARQFTNHPTHTATTLTSTVWVMLVIATGLLPFAWWWLQHNWALFRQDRVLAQGW